MIISVNGGTQTFELEDRLNRLFERGLVEVANATRACITTGGTDVGVIQLVSGIMHRYNVPVPIIGVCALRCVNRPAKMEPPAVIPAVTPAVTLDVTPAVTLDVTPDVTPPVTSDVTPDVTPHVTPHVTPDVTPAITATVTRRCVNGRDKMERRRSIDVVGRDVHYSHVEEASGTGAPLNPYHTHFLLVDDGSPEARRYVAVTWRLHGG